MQWHWKWPICMDRIINGHFAKAFKNLGLYETGQEIPEKWIAQKFRMFFSFFKFAEVWGNYSIYRVYGVLSDVWNFAPRSKNSRRSFCSGGWMPCFAMAMFQKNAFAFCIATVPLKRFHRNASIMYWNGMAGIFDKAMCNKSTKSKSFISRIDFDWCWSDSDCSRLSFDSFGYARPSTDRMSSSNRVVSTFKWFGLFLCCSGCEYMVRKIGPVNADGRFTNKYLSGNKLIRFKCCGVIMPRNMASPMLSCTAAFASYG